MKTNKLAAVALGAILLITSACSSETPENQQMPEPAPEKENNEEISKDEQPEPAVTLPQDLLHKTDQGEAVKAVEEALNHIGYTISMDGNYDAETTWAITDFQMQKGLITTGVYNEATRVALKEAVENNTVVEAGKALNRPDDNPSIVSNPHEILVLVNKEHALPAGFVPKNLVVPDVKFPFEADHPKKQMRKVAAQALEKMFHAASEKGLHLFAQSGYRSYERQDAIFASNAQVYGEEAANNFSARPGESEHQTGLTMDVSSQDVGFQLIIEFGETDEGKWLEQHAAEYGFIIRYPKGKEEITQYQYEPWHLRYVGPDAAKEIMEKGITLEEYLGVK